MGSLHFQSCLVYVLSTLCTRGDPPHVRPGAPPSGMADDGFLLGVGRIKRLRYKQVPRFTTTTQSNHAVLVVENVSAQTFVATRPNETWVMDITYVLTAEGWLYLAGIKDLFTCEVVGHARAARMTTELARETLFMAVRAKGPHPASSIILIGARSVVDRVHESAWQLLRQCLMEVFAR